MEPHKPQPVAASAGSKADFLSSPSNPTAVTNDNGISNSTRNPAGQQLTASPMLPMPPLPLPPGVPPTPAPHATTSVPPSRLQPSPPQQHPHNHQLTQQHTPPQNRRQPHGGPLHPFDPIPEELTPHPLVLSPASLLSPASSTTGGGTAATTGTAGSSGRRAGTTALSPLLPPRSSSAHTNPLFQQPGVPDASAVPPAMLPISPRATSSPFTSPPPFTSITGGVKTIPAAYGVQPPGGTSTTCFRESPSAVTGYDTPQPEHVRQPRFGSPYRVPSVQAVQQLLESDLPTHAIAAAVAALAGALPPLPWDAPPVPPSPLQYGTAGPSGNAPAGNGISTLTGSGASQPGRAASPGPPGSKAREDAAVVGMRDGMGSGTSAGVAEAAPVAAAGVPRVLPHRHAHGSAARLGSHVLGGLAGGEQGMPPKQLQEEQEAVAAGEAVEAGKAVEAGEAGEAEAAQGPEGEADGEQREPQSGKAGEGGLAEERGQSVDGGAVAVAGEGMEGAGASLSLRSRGSTLRGSGARRGVTRGRGPVVPGYKEGATMYGVGR